jgi:hypothetical protein
MPNQQISKIYPSFATFYEEALKRQRAELETLNKMQKHYTDLTQYLSEKNSPLTIDIQLISTSLYIYIKLNENDLLSEATRFVLDLANHYEHDVPARRWESYAKRFGYCFYHLDDFYIDLSINIPSAGCRDVTLLPEIRTTTHTYYEPHILDHYRPLNWHRSSNPIQEDQKDEIPF